MDQKLCNLQSDILNLNNSKIPNCMDRNFFFKYSCEVQYRQALLIMTPFLLLYVQRAEVQNTS